jgi:hypothetical protein
LFTGFTNQANTNVEEAFHLMETGNVIHIEVKKEAPGRREVVARGFFVREALVLLEELQICHPLFETNLPCAEGDAFALTDGTTMATVTVNVKLGLNTSRKQQVVVLNRLLGMKFIVLAGAGQECGTRIGWN